MSGFDHWLHLQPVAHIAWVSTVLAAILAIFVGMRFLFRRLTRSGDRAQRRLAGLLVLLLLGLAIEAVLDDGYRTRLGVTYAQTTAIDYARAISGRGPFPIGAYYAAEAKLGSHSDVVGTMPALYAARSWTDVRTRLSFRASILGLPADIGAGFRPRRTGSALTKLIASWQAALGRLGPGKAYVDRRLAVTGIQSGDILFSAQHGSPIYVTVAGALPDHQLSGSAMAIIAPLALAQTELKVPAQITQIQVVSSHPGGSANLLWKQVLGAATGISNPRLSGTIWQAVSTTAVRQAGDFDRWLALAGLATVVVASLGLLALGFRRA